MRLDQLRFEKKGIPIVIKSSIGLILFFALLGYAQINHGIINLQKLGIEADDPTLDMYGFDQVKEQFSVIRANDIESGLMNENSALVGNYWFPLANFDYYVATDLNMKCYGIGPLDAIHKYAWINRDNGGLIPGMDAYYLTTTRDFRPPEGNMDKYFERVLKPDTIQIYRDDLPVKKVFVYRMRNLTAMPPDELTSL